MQTACFLVGPVSPRGSETGSGDDFVALLWGLKSGTLNSSRGAFSGEMFNVNIVDVIVVVVLNN